MKLEDYAFADPMPHLRPPRPPRSNVDEEKEFWKAIAISASYTAICISDVTNVADGVLAAFKERFR